jgi:hypothetical protein
MVDTHAGAREDAQPWGAREKRGIDDRVGTDDRTDGIGDVRFAWIGVKRNVITSPTCCNRCHRVAECGTRHRWDLLPGATLGRGGGGRNDLGHMMGVVDCGVTTLAAGHREEELFRLDDLEIVVAHAGARTRLKVCIVAEVGVAEHGGVAEVRAASTQANAQLVHLLEVPGRGAFGAIDLEADAAFGSDDDREASSVPTAPNARESGAKRTSDAA